MLVVSLYLKVDESMLAGANWDTITELMSLLKAIDAAWIVGAEWSRSAQELQEMQLDRYCPGDLVVPDGGPTISTGSVLDF